MKGLDSITSCRALFQIPLLAAKQSSQGHFCRYHFKIFNELKVAYKYSVIAHPKLDFISMIKQPD